MNQRPQWLAPLLIALLVFIVYLLSPVRQVVDAKYTFLVSESLLTRGTAVLDPYFPATYLTPGNRERPRHLMLVDGHLYPWYPLGTPILSIPFVALARMVGISSIASDGSYSGTGEELLHRIVPPFVAALAAAMVFCLARRKLGLAMSLAMALAFAFATPMWSTASRAMWSHGWVVVFSLAALWLIMSAPERQPLWRLVVTASLVSFLYWIRPAAALQVVAFGCLFLAKRGVKETLVFGATGLAWLLLLFAVKGGEASSTYYDPASQDFAGVFHVEVFQLLFSPSRGVLTLMPFLPWLAWMSLRFRKELAERPLFVTTWLLTISHLLLLAQLHLANGGWSFGPRLFTDLLGWWAVLAIECIARISHQPPAADANHSLIPRAVAHSPTSTCPGTPSSGSLRETLGLSAPSQPRDEVGEECGLALWQASRPSRVSRALSAFLVAASAFIHGRGALVETTWEWNGVPIDIGRCERVHDWREPQFLAGLLPTPLPRGTYPALLPHRHLAFGTEDTRKYLWDGWSMWPELGVHRAVGRKARIIFSCSPLSAQTLRLKVVPFLHGDVTKQSVTVFLNGHRLGERKVRGEATLEFDLPAGVLASNNVLDFRLPDATSPKSLRHGDDGRLLSIGIRELRID